MTEAVFEKPSYPYAVGRISVIEDTLLTKEQYARLMSEDRDGQLRLLSEYGYGGGAGGGLEKMIDAELCRVKSLMDEIAPDTRLTDAFFFEYDAHNLKTLLKARLVGADADRMLLGCGVFETELLKVCVSADEYSLLGRAFAGLEALEGERNPQVISVAVDNSVYAHIFAQLAKAHSPLLLCYFRMKAGYANELTRIRAQRLGLSEETTEQLLIAGSFPKPDMAASDVRGIERECAVRPCAYLRGCRNDPFGVAALASYICDKQNEARNIRIIFAGGGEEDIDI